MKLFRFGEQGRERPAAVDQTGIPRDISSLCDDLAGTALSRSFLARLRSTRLDLLPRVPEAARRGACVAGTRHFIAVGLNFADHAAEVNAAPPTEPILFSKAPSCIVGPNDDVAVPQGAEKVDWEVELAVVIGERAFQVDEKDVEQVVAGYCICNDVSERAWQLERSGQWLKGKSAPTFGPLGPWLVTPDEIPDVQALGMWLDVNGQPMQRGSTSTMVFGVRTLVSYISQFMALEPGDVITTGTPPGVGMSRKPIPRYLRLGDVVSLGIEGLGSQCQTVVRGTKSTAESVR